MVDQLFQPASNLVETVEKALAATAVVYVGHLKSAAGSWRVAFPRLVNAETSGTNYPLELPRFNRKRWESVLLGNLNHFNLNRLQLKRLIPIEHEWQWCDSPSRMKPLRVTLKLGEKMKIYLQVLTSSKKHQMAISRCYFADDGKEMDKNEKSTCRACKAVVFGH